MCSSDLKIGRDVEILPFSHIENATLEANVRVGPFSRIRPGSFLSKGSRVGNFVEIKKSRVGKNSKILHLSYVGDTSIGKNANIGAGTITCNYDGKKKNKTKILEDRKSTRLNSSHKPISYAVFCLKKKKE